MELEMMKQAVKNMSKVKKMKLWVICIFDVIRECVDMFPHVMHSWFQHQASKV